MGQATHKTNRLTTQPQQDTENVDEEVPAAHKHLRFGGSRGVVTKAKTTSAMSRQPSKHPPSFGAEEKRIHQIQDIRTLTTHPQQGAENADEEVPAAHKHLRFGSSEGVVTKAKTTSAMSRQPSKHSTCSEAEEQLKQSQDIHTYAYVDHSTHNLFGRPSDAEYDP